jgi:hypothetical protein
MLPVSVIRSETAILHYFVVLLSLAAGILFTRNLDTYLKASRYSLLIAQSAIILYLARTGLVGFPLENILPDSSSNGVTSYLIVLQANYCLINYLLNRRASLLTSLTTLFICFVGYGRGSLLAAAGIVGVGLLSKTGARNRYKTVLRLLILSSIALFAIASYSPWIDALIAGTKISYGLYDESRATMIKEYLASLDAVTIWTGGGYTGTVISSQFNGNPHNSFIRAHHIFGLPYLVAVLLMPFHLTRRSHPPTVRIHALAMWALVMFRSFTEPILFPTLFDFFYFSTCFALSSDVRVQSVPRARLVV